MVPAEQLDVLRALLAAQVARTADEVMLRATSAGRTLDRAGALKLAVSMLRSDTNELRKLEPEWFGG